MSCSCGCKSLEYFVKACRCPFLSSKTAFRSYITIFKHALARWLRCLTVEISDVPWPAPHIEVLDFSLRKLGIVGPFFGMHRREKLQ